MFLTGTANLQMSICKVSEKNIYPFSRNGGIYRETEEQTKKPANKQNNQLTDKFDLITQLTL